MKRKQRTLAWQLVEPDTNCQLQIQNITECSIFMHDNQTPWMNKSRCFKSVGKRVYWDTKLQQTRSRIIVSITIYSVNSSFVDPLPIHLVVVAVKRPFSSILAQFAIERDRDCLVWIAFISTHSSRLDQE